MLQLADRHDHVGGLVLGEKKGHVEVIGDNVDAGAVLQRIGDRSAGGAGAEKDPLVPRDQIGRRRADGQLFRGEAEGELVAQGDGGCRGAQKQRRRACGRESPRIPGSFKSLRMVTQRRPAFFPREVTRCAFGRAGFS